MLSHRLIVGLPTSIIVGRPANYSANGRLANLSPVGRPANLSPVDKACNTCSPCAHLYNATHADGKAERLGSAPASITGFVDPNGVILTEVVNRHLMYFNKMPDTQSASATQIAVRTRLIPIPYNDDNPMTVAALSAKFRGKNCCAIQH